jgi:uncharacterized protein (TIGR02594 family)
MSNYSAKFLQAAAEELWVREVPGAKSHPRVLDYFRAAKCGWVKSDSTPWCSAFVCHVVDLVYGPAGLPHEHRLRARSWLADGHWPVEVAGLPGAIPGDIVVLWRGKPKGRKGHVGFYCTHDENWVWVLGGNQNNKVCVKKYPRRRVLGVRRLLDL